MIKKTVTEKVNEKIEKGFQTSCIVCGGMEGIKLVGHKQEDNSNFVGFIFSCRKCFPKIMEKKMKLFDDNQLSSLNVVQPDNNQNRPQELQKLEADNKLLQDKIWQLEKDQEQALEKIIEFKKERKSLETKISDFENNQKHSLELLSESELLQKQVFKLQEEQRSLLQKIAVLEKERQESVSNNFDAKEMEMKYMKQLNELKAEKEALLDNLQKLEKAEMTNWTLDVDKLNELKEFTLKSIEVRPGKNTHFVNGAFEAVGLLYRSIINDKPIKKEY